MLAPALTNQIRRQLFAASALFVLSAAVSPAFAQGRGHAASRGLPPGQAKKQVTPAQAVVVSRDVLVKYGFDVVRVETIKGGQVIYYRRGHNGRGRGLGPVEKMIVRPSGSTVVF
jgi:outer membrane receptor protein involved in Fe transport